MYSNMADDKFIAIMMTFYDAVKIFYTGLSLQRQTVSGSHLYISLELFLVLNTPCISPKLTPAYLAQAYIYNGQVACRGLSNTTLLISLNVTSGALLELFRWSLMYSVNGKCSQFQTSIKVIRDRYRFEKEPNDERYTLGRTLTKKSRLSAAFRGRTTSANYARR